MLTAFENVELPLLLTQLSRAPSGGRVRAAFEMVRLTDRLDHYPNGSPAGSSSASIARALVDPRLLVADEPTGDLDPRPAPRCWTCWRSSMPSSTRPS